VGLQHVCRKEGGLLDIILERLFSDMTLNARLQRVLLLFKGRQWTGLIVRLSVATKRIFGKFFEL
jgi:hypothetical protein